MTVHALVVDDDSQLLTSIIAAAAQRNLTLATATSWDDGIGLFNALCPDLVIADYNLPGSKHGLRLLFEIAKLRPSVRLILFSAYLNEADVVKVEALGLVDRVLRKVDPVTTAREVLSEVEAASKRGDAAPDWVAFAAGARSARNLSTSDFDALESLMHARFAGEGN